VQSKKLKFCKKPILKRLTYLSISDASCLLNFDIKSLDRKRFDWYIYVPVGVSGIDDSNKAGPLQCPLVMGVLNSKLIMIQSILSNFV